LDLTQATNRVGQTLPLDDTAGKVVDQLLDVARAGGTVYILGNGGSASIAGHLELDLSNRANIRARSFLHAPALTALANDHGYDHAYARLLQTHLHPGDALVLISSSGQSANMAHAVDAAREQHAGCIITLTGFDAHNPLRTRGDLNFFCPSRDYGEVEVAHQSLAHYFSDRCVAARQSPTPQVVVKTKTPALHR
jgi:D-sedoheptulose 7-phosphate isomerase